MNKGLCGEGSVLRSSQESLPAARGLEQERPGRKNLF